MLSRFEYLIRVEPGSDDLRTLCSKKSVRLSSGVTHAENFSLDKFTASAVYSLLDSVDSESIADEFDIGKHNKKHDSDNHLKVALGEGIDLSDTLAELKEATSTDAELEKIAASTFSRCMNDRDYRARSFEPCLSYSTPHS